MTEFVGSLGDSLVCQELGYLLGESGISGFLSGVLAI